MRIDWNIVSAISGVVSAIVAVISLFFLFRGGGQSSTASDGPKGTIFHYLLFSSAWVLLVIAFNWIFAPFGSYLFREDERKLYGIMISAPALMLGNYALTRLGMQRVRKSD
jgi:membrane associated rhomboid family serine protease